MKHLSHTLTITFSILLLSSCASDGKDTPEPPAESNKFPTQEQFRDQIANKLWIREGAKWMDDEGNIYPEMVGEGGFGDPDAYYFLDDKYIVFLSSIPSSIIFEKRYDSTSGGFFNTKTGRFSIEPQIIQFSSDTEPELIIKDYVGMYQYDWQSPKREDVWRYQRYVLEENPDFEKLIASHYPENYNPEDYGLK